MKNTVSKSLVLEALSAFPDAATKTIAEFLYRAHPAVFKNLEHARSRVRYYRGARGVKDRAVLANTEHVRELQAAGSGTFPAIPEGLTSFEDWGPLIIGGPLKALLLSDLHIPYHDRMAIEIAVERGRDADLVIINGDLADCYEMSRFEPDPRKCDFPGMLRKSKEFFTWLRAKFPKARILYKEGNHEERLERYFLVRAPAVLGVPEFELKNLMKLDDFGIEWLDEKRPIRLGKLFVIHGHEYRFAFSNPVNPARGLFLRAKVHAIQGHNHQSSQHGERRLDDKVVSTWSTGCLCDLHPEYMPLNNWGHGAALVELSDQGAFHVDNFRIIKGVAY